MSATSDLIQKIYIGYFGRAGDPEGLNYWVQRSSAGLSDAAIAQSFSVQDEATDMYGFLAAPSLNMGRVEFLNSVYQNLFGRDMDDEGEEYWIGQLDAGRPVGGIILDIINGAQNSDEGQDLTVITNKLAAANYYTEKVITSNASWTLADDQQDAIDVLSEVDATAASVTAAEDLADELVAADTAPAGQTFTLTAGVDSGSSFVGGSGNDTFNASFNSNGAQTLNGLDSIAGGAGTDTLIAEIDSSVTPTSLGGIEVLQVSATNAATLTLTNATDLTTVTNQSSTYALTLAGLATSVGVTLADTAVAQTINYASVTGSSDAATVGLDTVTDAADITVAGIETVTLNASGGTSSVDLVAAAAKTVNITGSATLTIRDLDAQDAAEGVSAAVTKVDASSYTGALNLTTGDLGTSAVDVTVSGGSGNDTLDVSAISNDVNVAGGAGVDRLVVGGNLTNTDTVNGGDGTDTLVTTYAIANGYTAADPVTISNVETLELSTAATGSVTTRNLDTSINKVILAIDDDTNAAATFNFNSGSSTLQVGTSATTAAALSNNTTATTLTVDAYGSGASDALTISNANASTADAFDEVAITSTDFETLNIDTGSYATAVAQTLGAISVTGSTGATSAETVNFSGANAITTLGAITADIVSAAGLTAAGTGSTFVMTTGNTATTITGSAGNDTLYGHATTASSVDGGAGRDGITGGTGADTLIGGAGHDTLDGAAGNDSLAGGDGNDSITAGANNDTIDGGAGADTLILGDNWATGDVIDGGDGTDTLRISDDSLDTILAYSLTAANALNNNLSNVEQVEISDDLDNDLDVGRVDGINTIILASGINGSQAISALTSGAAITIKDTSAAAGDELTLSLASDGSSDSFTVNLVNDNTTDFSEITLVDIESLTITTAEATATTTVEVHSLDINATASKNSVALSTLIVTGTETLDLTGTALNAITVDASGMSATSTGSTGALKFTGGSAAQSITGGGGADVIDGGSNADTIVGNGGADSLTGGSGNDSISGGAGADTLLGGTDIDTLVGGEAADQLEGGAGNDSIDLTETTSAADVVVINTVVGTSSDSGRATVTGNDNDTGSDTVTAFTWGTDVIRVVATEVADFTHVDDTFIGSATGDVNNGTAGSFLSTVGLIDLGGTGVVGDGDVAITFASPSASLTAARFEAALQYNLTAAAAGSGITGGDLADTLTGGAGVDSLTGGAGNDSISGGADADSLIGGAGADTIISGAGADTVNGGDGNDTINFGTVLVTNDTAGDAGDLAGSLASDQVTFVVADDTFVLSETIFGTMGNGASGAGAALLAAQFASVAGTAASLAALGLDNTGNGAILVDTTNSDIYFIEAGVDLTAGATDTLAEIIATSNAIKIADVTLTGVLTAADFSIVL